jgi:hypothetical protein
LSYAKRIYRITFMCFADGLVMRIAHDRSATELIAESY